MKKALLIGGIILATIAVIAFFGYKFIKKKISPVSVAIYAVPIDAAFVFQTDNIYEILRKTEHESTIWQELINIPGIADLNKKVVFLDSLLRLNQKAKDLFKNKPATISAHLVGDQRLEYLFVIALPSSSGVEDVNNFINEQINRYASIRTRNYAESEIFDVQFPKKENLNFSYAIKKGMFILSFSSIILENSLRQLDTETSLLDNPGYKKIQKTAGHNVDANIYINYKEFPKMMLLSCNKNNKDDVLAFKNFADWTALDLVIKKDVCVLNGMTYTNDSTTNYLNVFLKQKPQTITLPEILPCNTSVFIALGISDLGRFNTEYRKYLDFTGQSALFLKEMGNIKKETGVEVEKMIYDLIDKEIAVAFTDIGDINDISTNSFGIIKTVNKTQAEEDFLRLIDGYATNRNENESSMKINFKVDDQTSFPIYKMPYPGLLKRLFGNIFAKTEANYFTFIDNYMIFGQSEKTLGDFVHYKMLQKTLDDDKNFKQFSENLTTTSNFFYYSNIARSPVFCASFFNDELSKIVIDNTATFQKFQALAFQFSSSNDMLYNNICVKYNPVFKDEPKTVWERRIDTIASFRPIMIDNNKTGEKCIFVQDMKNSIYLINSVGNIIWKIDAKEKIMSNIYQIDYFKNKKSQLLFSTKNHIHVIDILGNYLKPFPLKLRSPATNGVSLADNDKKRNYKYFIAGEDKKIYAYSKEGNVLKDWKFKGSDNVVRSEIQFFEADKKDFVIFSDIRKTYITDRKGCIKIKPEKDFIRSPYNIFYAYKDKKETSFITTDSAGTIRKISTNGDVSSISLGNFTAAHYFIFDDINSDGIKEYVFADKQNISAYKANKALIYDRDLEDLITEKPIIFNFTKKTQKIGVTCGNTNKIFLINSNGSLYNGFPLAGKTMFSIDYFSKDNDNFNLVVGSNDHFIYNYEIK